jgi:holo-[acyl-carrier protein] synthase
MILGIGTDLIEVDRLTSSINKEKGFRELVFSSKEIQYCESRSNKFEHYAARFAAKEAFFKALGTGWRNDTAFNEIEILPDQNGKPLLHLLGLTSQTLSELQDYKILVSLSHLKSVASAVVIIEQ